MTYTRRCSTCKLELGQDAERKDIAGRSYGEDLRCPAGHRVKYWLVVGSDGSVIGRASAETYDSNETLTPIDRQSVNRPLVGRDRDGRASGRPWRVMLPPELATR